MIIVRGLYEKVLSSVSASAVETGGILGVSSGIVTECIFDLNNNEYGKYIPDTNMINKTIALWKKESIDFGGIFHSHYPSESKLSQQDIKYIKEIMLAVKDIYSFLYFPVIIPKKKMVAYKAFIKENKVLIEEDEILFA